MKVLVSLEQRYERTPDGAIWTPNQHSYSFFTRYLEVFDQVDVLARVFEVATVSPNWIRGDGPGVRFRPVPAYLGPAQYLAKYWSVRRAVAAELADCEAVIMRVPSNISHTLAAMLRAKQHPFALEVVADPYDLLSPGSVHHWGRPLFRWWFCRELQEQCQSAIAVAYVTASTLQTRYPASGHMAGISDVILPDSAFITTYSSVELDAALILSQGREPANRNEPVSLIFVGSLAQIYKAPDILLRALAKCVGNGCDLRLKIVGDGRFRGMLEKMALELGVGERCQFMGAIPAGAPILQELDQADIFVLPSRTEGLPRAIIEAMARGLPCIGSTAGGIPELLQPEDMVSPGDVDGLAALIQAVANDEARQRRMSIRNLAVSRQYADSVLGPKRLEFYRFVKEKSDERLRSQGSLDNNRVKLANH